MAQNGAAPQSSDSALDSTILSGVNAQYLEKMYAQYAADPNSVSAEWRAFFEREAGAPNGDAAGHPSWARDDWPPKVNGDLTAALDGDWGALEPVLKSKIEQRLPQAPAGDVRQATKDSLHALMLIRAYRIRGHLIADLDRSEEHTSELQSH